MLEGYIGWQDVVYYRFISEVALVNKKRQGGACRSVKGNLPETY